MMINIKKWLRVSPIIDIITIGFEYKKYMQKVS